MGTDFFGAMYSLVVFTFYLASALIVLAVAKPISLLRKKLGLEASVLPLPGRDAMFFYGFYGLLAWGILGVWFLFTEPSLVSIVITLLLIASMICILWLLNDSISASTDSEEQPIFRRIRLGAFGFCAVVICSAPVMLVDGVREQLTNKTLEKMGVRQLKVDVKFEDHALNSLKQHLDVKRAVEENLLVIDEQGWVYNVDILFSNVGTNSRVRLANSVNIDVPTSKIELVVRP